MNGRRRSFLRLMSVVARRDYLRTVRRRGFLIGTLLLPAAIAGFTLLSALFNPALQPSPPPAEVTVANESTVALIVPTGVQLRQMSRQEGLAAMESGQAGELYLIPASYPATAAIQRLTPGGRSPSIEDLQRWSGQEQVLSAVLRLSLLADAELPPPVVERLLAPYQISTVGTDGETPTPGFEAGFLLPYVFTLLFVFSIFITSGYLLQSVTEEKESRVVEIVLSSVPSQPLMAGKIVGLGAAGLTQVLIWVATALAALPFMSERMPALRGLSIDPIVFVLALAFFVSGYLAYGAIFAAIGALAPGTREAQQYSGFFGFFAVIPMIFAGVFFADPGSPIVTVLSLIPLTAPAAMLQLLAVLPEPPWPLVIASLTSVTVFAVLAAIAASRVFRATLLLYGVRPSLGRIVGAITARG